MAVGVAAWLAYVTYLVVFGRAAAAQGFTGELGEVRAGRRPTSGPAADQSSTTP